MNQTLQETAFLLIHLGVCLRSPVDAPELSVSSGDLPAVETTCVYEEDRPEVLRWVSIRAPGVQTRSVFPTKDPADLPQAVAKNILAALLELAAQAEASLAPPEARADILLR